MDRQLPQIRRKVAFARPLDLKYKLRKAVNSSRALHPSIFLRAPTFRIRTAKTAKRWTTPKVKPTL